MSKVGKEKLCVVCGLEGKCVGFSKICCKSCSVFYRRSYKLRNVLKCKREGNCNLRHELRNVCRYCRLQACRKLGLRMVGKNLIVQNNGYPEDDVDEEEQPSTSQKIESVPDEPHTTKTGQQLAEQAIALRNGLQQHTSGNIMPKVDEMFHELKRIVEAFVNFENNQRLISSIQQGKQIQAYESVYMTKCQQFAMESATLRLLQQMLEQLLSDCNLKEDDMKAIFEHTPLQLGTAHKAELTSRVFPARGDSRMSFFVGYHLDINKLEHFLNSPADFERMKKIAWPLLNKRWEAAERCRQLAPSTIEWCCFYGVMIFEELSRLGIKNEIITRRQNALYSEYFQYLLSIYHDASVVASRIIKIISFVHDIGVVREAHAEMYSIADIFLPNYQSTVWVTKPGATVPSLQLNK